MPCIVIDFFIKIVFFAFLIILFTMTYKIKYFKFRKLYSIIFVICIYIFSAIALAWFPEFAMLKLSNYCFEILKG